VIERIFGTLKHEHLFRGAIADGDALDMEVHRFRIIYDQAAPSDRRPNNLVRRSLVVSSGKSSDKRHFRT
jgi:putative transposase